MLEFMSNAQEILLALFNCQDKRKYSLHEIAMISKMNYRTVINNVQVLVDAGMLQEERQAGFPVRRLVQLTEKGTLIGQKLLEVKQHLV